MHLLEQDENGFLEILAGTRKKGRERERGNTKTIETKHTYLSCNLRLGLHRAARSLLRDGFGRNVKVLGSARTTTHCR